MICWAQTDTILIIYPKDPQLMELKETDTILFNSPMDVQILYGTMAIPETGNQLALWSYSGLRLQSVIGSDCSGEHEGIIERIESVEKNDSMWIISTQITSNCCHKFLGDAALESDSIINLKFIGYGGNCACTCCFGLTYTFIHENEDYFQDYKWVMINDDRRTLFKIED
jgi:hypothetical protein